MRTRQERMQRVMTLAPMMLVFGVGAVFIAGTVVKLLWNWLVPWLFGLPALTFWQALGVLLLSRILFGGHGGMKRRSPEERARFRRGWNKRFGVDEPSSESPQP
jgi:hypothetical protein